MKTFGFKLGLASVVTTLILLAPTAASAAIYIKFEGVEGESSALEGESSATGFEKQIVATSAQFGLGTSVNIAQGSKGAQVSRASFSEITLSKDLDKSSPRMMEVVAKGARVEKAIISFTTSSGTASREQTFYKYELQNVIVSSYSVSSGGDGRPSESFSLNFAAIKVSYFVQKPDGSLETTPIEGQWNLVTNRPDFRSTESVQSQPVIPGSKPASTGTEVTVE